MKNQTEDLVSEIRLTPGQIASWEGRQSLCDGSVCVRGSSCGSFYINPSLLSAASHAPWIRAKVPVYHPFVLFPVVNKHQSITPSQERFLSQDGIQL